ncbi:unnamed protein product [Staurois parvus]|uniref:Uncharacterized protein n=1 Tax=Staurois parvus TaxID=386267 RepID=A0ABN9AVW6_9NEOB|nr:unnamed protein product [Staurois parvus]
MHRSAFYTLLQVFGSSVTWNQGWTDNSWGPPGNRGSWGPSVLAQTQKSL